MRDGYPWTNTRRNPFAANLLREQAHPGRVSVRGQSRHRQPEAPPRGQWGRQSVPFTPARSVPASSSGTHRAGQPQPVVYRQQRWAQ